MDEFSTPEGTRAASIARAYNRAVREIAHQVYRTDDRGRRVQEQGSLKMTLDPSGNLLIQGPREKTVFLRHADGSLERRWSRGGNHRHERIFADGRIENLFQRYE